MLGGGWWGWHARFHTGFPWSAVPDPLCGLNNVGGGVGSVHWSPPEQVVAGGGVESSDAVAVVVHEFDNVLVVSQIGVSADAVGGCAVFADGVFGGDGFGVFCVGDDGCGGGAYCLEHGGLGSVVDGGFNHGVCSPLSVAGLVVG